MSSLYYVLYNNHEHHNTLIFCFMQDNFGSRIEGEEAKAVIHDSSVDPEN